MKKILLATTVLAASAGIAAADVTVSGLGRFGLNYNDGAAVGTNETTIGGRLRFNIDASTETDTGVEFGGRVRLQYDIGNGTRYNTTPNAGLLYVSYGGLRVEVGNTNTAIDSADLWYASEIGYDYSISGNGVGNFYAYSTNPTDREYVGVFASYSFGDFTGRISYIQPDQYASTLPLGVDDELSISFDYASGPIAISFGAVQDSEGVAGDDSYFLGGQYSFGDAEVALLYYDEEVSGVSVKTTTLTGNYTIDAIKLQGFLSSSDDRGTEDLTYGIGAQYDLGGATLAGAVGKTWSDATVANIGVRFSF